VGLTINEFVMAVEEAFGITIPDEDLGITTPRDLVEYLLPRLVPPCDPNSGLSWRSRVRAPLDGSTSVDVVDIHATTVVHAPGAGVAAATLRAAVRPAYHWAARCRGTNHGSSIATSGMSSR
jgi:hypothetical protein